eukprot:TRINITY_DN920_c0_g1_i1.p1 TRINITY_DN920_c0_g1~~TRINITY_DN920_c0_g1_i1.p1  ORF type:complete len:147 (+),score=37.70 TRINITY_DN920_c0_g1_i1:80-520(+)
MPSDLASSQLQWLLVKKNNSFLVRRDGLTFSREPLNLKSVNRFRYSGIVNSRAAGLAITPGKKGVTLIKKKKGANLRRPRSSQNRIQLTRDFRRVARTIKHELNNYRPDLKKAALARWSMLYGGIKAGSGISKKKKVVKKTRGAKK